MTMQSVSLRPILQGRKSSTKQARHIIVLLLDIACLKFMIRYHFVFDICKSMY